MSLVFRWQHIRPGGTLVHVVRQVVVIVDLGEVHFLYRLDIRDVLWHGLQVALDVLQAGVVFVVLGDLKFTQNLAFGSLITKI